METQHKELFIKINLEKSTEAMKIAHICIKENSFTSALNRIYYSLFYAVTALACKHDFTTPKHSKLLGQFNKKIVYEDTILDAGLYKTYEKAFINRQESDYRTTYVVDEKFVKSLLNEAEEFITQIRKII